jgi:hypothetical protein
MYKVQKTGAGKIGQRPLEINLSRQIGTSLAKLFSRTNYYQGMEPIALVFVTSLRAATLTVINSVNNRALSQKGPVRFQCGIGAYDSAY